MGVIDLSKHTFVEPKKSIHEPGDLDKFTKSNACGLLMMFVQKLCTKVENKPISGTKAPAHLEGLMKVFHRLNKFVDETPPIHQPMRYGNKAYQTWHDKMKAEK